MRLIRGIRHAHWRTVERVVLACVGCLLTAGIGSSDASATALFSTQLQVGDTVVKAAGAPRHRGVGRLVRELSIGTVDGPAEYTFTAVNEVVALRDGSVLVLDGSAGTESMLRLYDVRGTYLHSIGRRGRGPGEFGGPGGVTQLPDGRILLLDVGGRRINVYDADGRSTDTWNLPDFILSTGGTGRLRADATGVVHLHVSIRAANNPTPGDLMRSFRRAVVRLRSNGAIIDTIFAPEMPRVPDASVTKTSTSAGGTSSTSVDVPYMPTAIWTWSPRGYMITGIPSRYAFELRVPRTAASDAVTPLWRTGDPVISVRRSVAPVAVSRAERADQRSYIERRLAAAPGSLNRTIPDIPRQKPAYKQFLVGDDGRIWVALSTPSQRYDPETAPPPAPPVGIGIGPSAPRGGRPAIAPAPWREPAVYDVFESDGAYLGQVAVPFDTRLLSMSGNVVWAIATDELGVQYVRRFRISWGS